ncbi:OLC1v1030522C1 [Oldenlandia corymbosa var. corymbosa]|uniref:non-reducing end alpha-L-arabinofuranosidase n=1 Tax=Oldenlandia corymbosa var. corymbosa TaxID=529605 RepID=A0AAV1CGZ9_OLDCO|nr:OLC1v1030522C1 [Oldenlandia corymbosa var. corymbosa]
MNRIDKSDSNCDDERIVAYFGLLLSDISIDVLSSVVGSDDDFVGFKETIDDCVGFLVASVEESVGMFCPFKDSVNPKFNIPAYLNEENDRVILDLTDGEVVTLELGVWNVDSLYSSDSALDVNDTVLESGVEWKGVDSKGNHQSLFAIEPCGIKVEMESIMSKVVCSEPESGSKVLEKVKREPVGMMLLVDTALVKFDLDHDGEMILDDCFMPLNDVSADMMDYDFEILETDISRKCMVDYKWTKHGCIHENTCGSHFWVIVVEKYCAFPAKSGWKIAWFYFEFVLHLHDLLEPLVYNSNELHVVDDFQVFDELWDVENNARAMLKKVAAKSVDFESGLECPSDANVQLESPSLEESFDLTEEMGTVEVTNDEHYGCVYLNLDYIVTFTIAVESTGNVLSKSCPYDAYDVATRSHLLGRNSTDVRSYMNGAQLGGVPRLSCFKGNLKGVISLVYIQNFCDHECVKVNVYQNFKRHQSSYDVNLGLQIGFVSNILSCANCSTWVHSVFLPYDPGGRSTYAVPFGLIFVELVHCGSKDTLFKSLDGTVLIELNCKYVDAGLFLFLSSSITKNVGCLFAIDPGGLVHLSSAENVCSYRAIKKGYVLGIHYGDSLHSKADLEFQNREGIQWYKEGMFIASGANRSIILDVEFELLQWQTDWGQGTSAVRTWYAETPFGGTNREHSPWTRIVTCFRGGTIVCEGNAASMEVDNDTNFIWMIAWYTLGAVAVGLEAGSNFYQCCSADGMPSSTATLHVNASPSSGRKMPDNLFGVFWEEINHAGHGGVWAELVSNRGFEARDGNNKLILDPWTTVGDASSVRISTDNSSLFQKNKVALKMEVLCDKCPQGGVGISNPGFWGMNIVEKKSYNVVFYVRSQDPIDLFVTLKGSNGKNLAQQHLADDKVSNWKKIEMELKATASDTKSSLQLTTSKKGVIWFDQVSVMPQDTYKGHGFRQDLFKMAQGLKPKFFRFPGGCFVEGKNLPYALAWKDTVGPWEERPGHYNDIWNYWTDDALGHFEGLQLAEDLGALPVWVFSIGISVEGDEVDPDHVGPLIQDALDGIEFAVGDPKSKWGSVRAAMGHPKPFDLRHVAPGNEDCGKPNYNGNYQKSYDAIRKAYPNIKIISNCDGSVQPLAQPADLYDYHTYPNATDMYDQQHHFDKSPRNGAKAFVSEYAVYGKDAGMGSLLGALAESAFLMGLERNSDVVELASYAPLFTNINDKTWIPDSIYFDSWRVYATPSYYMQQFFIQSNGATYLNSALNTSDSVTASAILWQDKKNKKHLRIKVVNFGKSTVNLNISIEGLGSNSLNPSKARKIVMTSTNPMDENSFEQPTKIAPVTSKLEKAGNDMNFVLSPYSLNSFDMSL